MLNSEVLDRARQLQAESSNAYVTFKKNPTVTNAKNWSTATRTFNDFCVTAIKELLKETEKASSDVASNLKALKTCKQCGAELLFSTTEGHFIASSDFLEDFPGWCYSCLVEHCEVTDCMTCAISKDPSICSFKKVKETLNETDN